MVKALFLEGKGRDSQVLRPGLLLACLKARRIKIQEVVKVSRLIENLSQGVLETSFRHLYRKSFGRYNRM